MQPDDKRIETIKGDTHDAAEELGERVKATGERLKRTVEGGEMPLGERLGSHVRELEHDIKGDTARVRRELRDEDAQEDGI